MLDKTQAIASPTDRKGALVLKANALIARIFSSVDLTRGEQGWDVFDDEFRAIVALSSAVIGDGLKAQAWQNLRPHSQFISSTNAEHAFSLGIVTPLCEVCARCRDPTIRDSALQTLQRLSRRECMWSSWSVWKVEKYLLQLEERPWEEQALRDGFESMMSNEAGRGQMQDTDVPALEDKALKLTDVRFVIQVRRELNPGLFTGTMGQDEHKHKGLGVPSPNSLFTD